MRPETECDLFRRLAELQWSSVSIDEVRSKLHTADLVALRGRHCVETFSVGKEQTILNAVAIIRKRKGNSRLRIFVTTRANNRP